MFATFNSDSQADDANMLWPRQLGCFQARERFSRTTRLSLVVGIFAGSFLSVFSQKMADDLSPTNSGETAAARIGREYREASERFAAHTNDAEAAWQFGRACFDLSDVSTNNAERAEIADRGIAACRASVALQPGAAPAHYYLGMDLGELADTKRNLAALRMVKEMEREFLATAALDETFDFAGADRNLGLLYMRAPVIASIGSRSKARQHFRRAVELAPLYPENRLNLVEALLKWGDLDAARREANYLEELWPEARQRFSGPRWADSWLDWEKRIQAVKRRTGQDSKPAKRSGWSISSKTMAVNTP